ncbi:uncharacterized protein LOC119785398 isoform X3 [Cyprinodon tularosa]|uniref:uncharacterized protein LOC119785398 isoform X3 n=1 Tax=Cyprinodon tularosa TaxID=77115 RepID=UPI0018E26849|nr:uncharacterized protein LOC119785398 isoform X3 [Cyprinodon tularosa]
MHLMLKEKAMTDDNKYQSFLSSFVLLITSEHKERKFAVVRWSEGAMGRNSEEGGLTTGALLFLSVVEIHPGTGVMIEKLAWAYAINANSATVFVRHLLTAVFPTETLLVQLLRSGLGPNPPALVSQSMPRSQNSEPKVKMSLSQNPLRWLVCHTLCEDIDCHTVSGQVFINPLFCQVDT